VRTYLIVILACTAATTVILGLAILGLRRLLVLVREQRTNYRFPKTMVSSAVCKARNAFKVGSFS
jgi:hypothetical protein